MGLLSNSKDRPKVRYRCTALVQCSVPEMRTDNILDTKTTQGVCFKLPSLTVTVIQFS